MKKIVAITIVSVLLIGSVYIFYRESNKTIILSYNKNVNITWIGNTDILNEETQQLLMYILAYGEKYKIGYWTTQAMIDVIRVKGTCIKKYDTYKSRDIDYQKYSNCINDINNGFGKEILIIE